MKKSFTLIELLVVIAIIGVLAALIIPSINNARTKARDAKRLEDLRQFSLALEMYYSDNNHYPIWEEGGGLSDSGNPLIIGTTSSPVFFTSQYMAKPTGLKDPLPSKYCYYYQSDSIGANFKLAAYLEKDTEKSQNDAGTASSYYEVYQGPTGSGSAINIDNDTLAAAMPGYVPPPPSWACGDTLTDDRDNKTYATVLIGTQCWMAEHLNYGTMTAGANNQGSDCPSVAETEKYCYGDTESSCTSDGALYQWAQAMCGAASCNGTGESQPACTTPVQGICPNGWHIPSHYEYTALERAVCTSGTCATDFPYDTSTTGWRGTNEGGKLKGTTICGLYPCWNSPNEGATNSSGFTAWAAGYRDTGGSFYFRGARAYIWSSLESGTGAWSRHLNSGYAAVARRAIDKLYGFSVRCIKD